MNRTNSKRRFAAVAVVAVLVPLAVSAEPVHEPRDCVMSPHIVIDVSSAVPGLLQEVAVERSDDVHAGQVLARLESVVEEASLELARAWSSIESEVLIEQATRSLDRRRHDRLTQLYQSRAVALDDKERAETEAQLAGLRMRYAQEKRWIRKLDARKAEATLERRLVRSPIDGVVVERFRAAGEYVENQPVLRIAQLDPLEVETILPMSLFGAVTPGMVAEVRAENAPEQTRRAVVRLVDRMGDPASGTFGVRLTLPNPGARIPAGLKCTLRFLPGEHAPVPSGHPAAAMPDGAEPGKSPGAATTTAPPPAPAVERARSASTPGEVAPAPGLEHERVRAEQPSPVALTEPPGERHLLGGTGWARR